MSEKKRLSFSDILMIQKQDEEDDTLSFCDLPIYSNAAEWAKYSSESQCSICTSTSLSTSSSSEEEGDYFEFFSEEWNKNAISQPPDNIIFCGKLIPSKKQPSPENALNPEKKISRDGSGGGLLRIFRTMNSSSRKGVTTKKKSDDESSSSKLNRNCYSSANDDAVRNLSKMRSSLSSSPSGKSRWLLIFFGFSKVPTEMELRDINNRKNRRITSSPQLENGDVENAIVSSGDGTRRRLWWLIRALSCGGSYPTVTRSVCVDGLGFPSTV